LIEQYERIIRAGADIPPRYAEAALRRLGELPRGGCLLHGDLHPGNVMLRQGRPVILDWSSISTGSAEADVARTRLLLDLAELPPGSPVVVRLAAPFARWMLRNAYMRAYRSRRAIDRGLLAAWELPVAVVRLAEGVRGERKRLTRYIEERLTPGS
jgi:aminoglycoside phosphotransferase (APT) family kinase protein